MSSGISSRHRLPLKGFQRLTPRRKAWVVAGGVLLLVLMLWCVTWFHWRFNHVTENDAHITGEVITLSSRVDGWLVARPVMDGDRVKKGQILAQIDDRAAQLRLAAVQGDLAAADAQIAYIQAQRQTADLTTEAELDQAQAQLTVAESALSDAGHQLALAQANFQRDDSLVKSGLTPRKTWDESHTTLLQRQDQQRETGAQLLAQRAALANARAQRGQLQVLDRQIDMQRQQVVALQAQVDLITQEIADRTLRSPVDGVVDRTLGDVGDYIQAGQWVMMVHDPKNVWVEANVKETALNDVAVGQPVDIGVDAYPGMVQRGHVVRVGNTATNQFALLPSPNPSGNFTKITQRVPVRIAFDGKQDQVDPRLKPGLMVEVAINVAD